MHSRFLRLVLLFPLVVSLTVIAQRGGSRGGGGYSGPRVVANPTYQPGPTYTHPNVHHVNDEGLVEFRSETILVQVPVVVTDKSGKHVAGLSRTDFEVKENGQQQKIASFEEIEASQVPLAAPTPHNGEYSNLGGAGEVPRSVMVIVLDSINTPYLDQAYGRKELIRYLADNVQSGQVLGLVSIGGKGLKVIHGLTSDPNELIAALKKVNGELPALQGVDIDTRASSAANLGGLDAANALNLNGTQADLENFVLTGEADAARLEQDRAIEGTLKAFLDIAWSLSGVPGKKALVWATSGFPFFLDTPAAVPGGYLSTLYERTMEALNDAQISIYPVDVRGLINYSPLADASASSSVMSNRNPFSANSLQSRVSSRAWLQSISLDTLRDFAEMTGGRAFYNTNDITSSFRRAAEDSASYYLLGYYLDTKNNKPGWRNLKVKVNKPGIEVRARTGFLVSNATFNPELSKKNDIAFALSSPFESSGIPLTMRWKATTADGDKRKVAFGLHVAPEGITTEGTQNRFDLEVVTMAVKNGVVADNFGQTIAATPNPTTLAKLKTDGLAYSNNLELPPGQYTVRFLVRDNLSGRMGSVSAPLTVN